MYSFNNNNHILCLCIHSPAYHILYSSIHSMTPTCHVLYFCIRSITPIIQSTSEFSQNSNVSFTLCLHSLVIPSYHLLYFCIHSLMLRYHTVYFWIHSMTPMYKTLYFWINLITPMYHTVYFWIHSTTPSQFRNRTRATYASCYPSWLTYLHSV